MTPRRASTVRPALFLSAASVLAGAVASPALAQADTAAEAPAAEAPDTSGEIVVTAQFREQNIQDTPIAITAIDAGTLDARGQTPVTDPGDSAPNAAPEPAR